MDQELHHLIRIVFQELLCSGDQIVFLEENIALGFGQLAEQDIVIVERAYRRDEMKSGVCQTYTQINFAAFRDFFRKDL